MGDVADFKPDIALVTKGADLQAFDAFFEEQRDRLLRIMSIITGSTAEAEDLSQDAFTKVFERWDRVGTMEDHCDSRAARYPGLVRVLERINVMGLKSPRSPAACFRNELITHRRIVLRVTRVADRPIVLRIEVHPSARVPCLILIWCHTLQPASGGMPKLVRHYAFQVPHGRVIRSSGA